MKQAGGYVVYALYPQDITFKQAEALLTKNNFYISKGLGCFHFRSEERFKEAFDLVNPSMTLIPTP